MVTLVICAILYIGVSIVMTGVVNYQFLNVPAPISVVIEAMGSKYVWLNLIISIGAIFGMTSVLLVLKMGISRVIYSISKDGLLPNFISNISNKFKTPYIATIFVTIIGIIMGGLFSIDVLAQMVSIGTLMAFTLVSLGVIVLRKTDPQLPRGFKVPFMPIIPILAIIFCLALMFSLPFVTWERLLIWLLIGLGIYGFYGFKHSKLNE